MELANDNTIGRAAARATEGLQSVSRFLGGTPLSTSSSSPNADPLSLMIPPLPTAGGTTHFHHRTADFVSLGQPAVVGSARASHFRVASSFQHHLLASQIICSRCNYRGELKLTPESCFTLFPGESPIHRKSRVYLALVRSVLEIKCQSASLQTLRSSGDWDLL